MSDTVQVIQRKIGSKKSGILENGEVSFSYSKKEKERRERLTGLNFELKERRYHQYTIKPEHRFIGYSFQDFVKCYNCKLWIRRDKIQECTIRKGKIGRLYHTDCGYPIRQHARTTGYKRRVQPVYID